MVNNNPQNKSCWVVEAKDPSSLEEKLKEKVKQKEESISDAKIKHALNGVIETNMGQIRVLTTELQPVDKNCNIKARLGVGRENYSIPQVYML